MLEMIAAELFKASRKKRFWVLLILGALVFPGFQLLTAGFAASRVGGTAFDQNDSVARAVSELASPYGMARNLIGSFAIQPWLTLLPVVAIVSIFLVGEERGFKMWKTILVANPNRMRVLLSKFLSGMVLLALLFVGAFAGSMVFGLLGLLFGYARGFGGDLGTLVSMYFLQWLVLVAPLAFGFLVSWLVGSTGIAVFLIILFPYIVETIIRGVILAQTGPLSPLNAPLEAARIREAMENIPRFFLTPNLSIGSRLLGEDATNILGNSVPNVLPTLDWSQIGWSLAVAGVYFLLFAGLMIYSFTSRDVHE